MNDGSIVMPGFHKIAAITTIVEENIFSDLGDCMEIVNSAILAIASIVANL